LKHKNKQHSLQITWHFCTTNTHIEKKEHKRDQLTIEVNTTQNHKEGSESLTKGMSVYDLLNEWKWMVLCNATIKVLVFFSSNSKKDIILDWW